jgi:hypothetical protein
MKRFPVIIILLLILSLILTSCFKEDERVEPYDRGDVVSKTIAMTQYYTNQVYFDLEKGEEVSVSNKNEWDLQFECLEQGNHIILNTSAFMYAGNTGLTDFEQVSDTIGLRWKFDKSDGNLDSTAIGNWFTIFQNDTAFTQNVYIINRGYTDLGTLRGLKKIQFNRLAGDTYYFRFANLNGSDEHEFTVQKDPASSFTCFSFENGGQQLFFEPPYNTWDLLFTQYTTLLYTDAGDPYPYLVTGVLLNRKNVVVVLDTITEFSDLTISSTEGKVFSGVLDFIGYDWKDLVGDVNSGNVSYVIVPGRSYIIKNRSGFIYKLRFTGFYNSMGEKGYPTIEFKLM